MAFGGAIPGYVLAACLYTGGRDSQACYRRMRPRGAEGRTWVWMYVTLNSPYDAESNSNLPGRMCVQGGSFRSRKNPRFLPATIQRCGSLMRIV